MIYISAHLIGCRHKATGNHSRADIQTVSVVLLLYDSSINK